MCQWVAVDDAPEMAQVLDAKRENVGQIIEKRADPQDTSDCSFTNTFSGIVVCG